jgi:MFS family permease
LARESSRRLLALGFGTAFGAGWAAPAFPLLRRAALGHDRNNQGWGRGRGIVVGSAALVIAAVVLVVSLIMGWYANRTYVAHSDIKTTRGRISGYRRIRFRSGLIALVVIVITVLAAAAVINHR